MRLLLDEARRERIEILIPSVVFQETVRRFREKIQDVQRSLAGFERELGRLGLDAGVLESVKTALKQEANIYQQYFHTVLEDHNARFIDIPDISHQQILNRIISRRKPISDDGKRGYQDVLIWETILDTQESSSDTLYFITNNSSDFADGSNRNKLAEDLVEDMVSRCGSSECIILFNTLREFTDEHVKPSRELPIDVGSVDSVPNRGAIFSLLESFLNGYAKELIGASPDAIARTTLPLEDLAITESEYSKFTVQEMFRISDDEIGVSCMAEFRVMLRGRVDKDIDPSVLGSWTRQAGNESANATIRSKASLYVDMDLTLSETRQQVIESQPRFSWAEIDDAEPPPSSQLDRI